MFSAHDRNVTDISSYLQICDFLELFRSGRGRVVSVDIVPGYRYEPKRPLVL